MICVIFLKIVLKNTIQIKNIRILIVFDDVMADMFNNKKINAIVTKLFIRGIKLNVPLVLFTQSYFAALKNIRLNSTLYFILKIPNKQELQQISSNTSSDIDFKEFLSLYRKRTAKRYSFLLLMLLLHLIIHHVLESIFLKECKKYS